ncbi:MAG: ATP-binding protein [Anaerolineae bacterium]
MGRPARLKVSGEYRNLARISDFVGQIAENMGFSSGAIHAIQMAVDEACTNAIDHAYGGEGKGDLELICEPLPDALRITLCDRGQPFDPVAVPEPDISAPLEKRKERGLGLFLMRRLMDEVSFSFDEKRGNRLVMIKHRNYSGQRPQAG